MSTPERLDILPVSSISAVVFCQLVMFPVIFRADTVVGTDIAAMPMNRPKGLCPVNCLEGLTKVTLFFDRYFILQLKGNYIAHYPYMVIEDRRMS